MYLNTAEFIAETQGMLGLSDGGLEIEIKNWIATALGQLYVEPKAPLFYKTTIENLKVKKPENFSRLAHIYIGSDCIEPRYEIFSECCPIVNKSCSPDSNLRCMETDTHFIFSSSANGKKVMVIYFGAAEDGSGLPLIPAYTKTAVMSLCDYMFLKQQRRIHQGAPSRMNPISLSEMDQAYNKWVRDRAEARAHAMSPSSHQLTQTLSEIFYSSNGYPVKA